MRGSTHAAAGIATGILLSNCFDINTGQSLLYTACSIIGSLFPDIDNTSSKIGQHTKPASYLIQLFIGHRTFFHAPVIYLIAAILITSAYPGTAIFCTAFLAGAASHLTLDSLNPAGIPLFWPLNKHFNIAKFQSGGIMDRCLGLLLWIFVLFLLWKKASLIITL